MNSKLFVMVVLLGVQTLASAGNKYVIDLWGSTTSNECHVAGRYMPESTEAMLDMTLSCRDLLKKGFAYSDKGGEFHFTKKVVRMGRDKFIDAMYGVAPAFRSIHVTDTVQIDPEAGKQQYLTLGEGQALEIDREIFPQIVIADSQGWKLLGNLLIPTTQANETMIYLMSENSNSSVQIILNVKSNKS